MSLKVVFVTSAQPSANPRMLKSALTLDNLGYDVTVIYARISEWADKFDKNLFQKQKNIKWIGVGVSNKKTFLEYYYRGRQKIWKFLSFLTLSGSFLNARGFTLYSQELEFAALNVKADLYIGHNLGALRAVVLAAKKFNSKSIFDIEDYYSGEYHKKSFYCKLINKYQDLFLNQLSYTTVSSPLIGDLYQSTIDPLKIFTLLNVFSVEYANQKITAFSNRPLKLFWFSQFVGLERGLQIVLKAMSYFGKGEICFTIVGNCNKNHKEYFQKLISELNLSDSDIIFHDAIDESELFSLMQSHHIGIASEVPVLLNKDICLSNKMFSYLLAGLALVVTNTQAQANFLSINSDIGFVFEYNDEKRLVECLRMYIQNPDMLDCHRENALLLAKDKYNWEIQSASWISLVNYLIRS